MRRKYAILVVLMYSPDIQTVIVRVARFGFPIPYFLLRYMPFPMAKDAFPSLETCPIAVRNMPDRTSIHGFSQRRSPFWVFHSLKMAILCSISPENPAQLFNQKTLQVSNSPNVCQPLESRMLVSDFILLKCGEISICLPEPYIFIQNNSCFTLHFVIILLTLSAKGGLEPAFISSHLT